MTTVLILGGTAEARALAHALAEGRPDLRVMTSLAGATDAPLGLPGDVRRGGFGGPEGLAAYIHEAGVDLVVDATHPFAARISANAVHATTATGTPYLYLDRPAWPLPDTDVVFVPDAEEAARLVARTSKAALLTIGTKGLSAFEGIEKVKLVARVIEEPPAEARLDNVHYILGRPPFDVAAEEALMREHHIDTLVSKASGGDATHAKLEAAARIGARIVMLRRPPPPDGAQRVFSVDDALRWISERA